MLRDRPGTIFAIVFAGLVSLPVMPQTFWDRMATIGDGQAEQTGSRDQRIQLMKQGLQVFANYPLTGVGAGQFQNYDGPEMVERWRVTHNVWLQVAAELGIFGLATFAFLVWRAFSSAMLTQRFIRPPRKKRGGRPSTVDSPPSTDDWTTLTPAERRMLDTNSKATIAGLAGWFMCAFFASVAFNWTFYYVFALAVAGRDIALARRVVPARHGGPAPARVRPARLTA
jgi:O-antigen ligase